MFSKYLIDRSKKKKEIIELKKLIIKIEKQLKEQKCITNYVQKFGLLSEEDKQRIHESSEKEKERDN